MTRLLLTALLLALTTGAHAQIQPGPNIAPNGMRFTFSPRFGYLGPPVAFVYGPPPVQNRAMPMVVVPRDPPPPTPPMRQIERPTPQAQVAPPIAQAPRLPGPRKRSTNWPCPDGCPREPDDQP